MSNELERVYKTFHNKNDVLILSHTVSPEEDSVNILKDYATLHGVKDNKWLFLTGEKKHLYDMARQGYLLNNETGSGDEDDFIHTQNFALVDKEGNIRCRKEAQGNPILYYDGLETSGVEAIKEDIKKLLEE